MRPRTLQLGSASNRSIQDPSSQRLLRRWCPKVPLLPAWPSLHRCKGWVPIHKQHMTSWRMPWWTSMCHFQNHMESGTSMLAWWIPMTSSWQIAFMCMLEQHGNSTSHDKPPDLRPGIWVVRQVKFSSQWSTTLERRCRMLFGRISQGKCTRRLLVAAWSGIIADFDVSAASDQERACEDLSVREGTGNFTCDLHVWSCLKTGLTIDAIKFTKPTRKFEHSAWVKYEWLRVRLSTVFISKDGSWNSSQQEGRRCFQLPFQQRWSRPKHSKTSWSVNLVEGSGTVLGITQVAGGLTMPAALPYPVRAGGVRPEIGGRRGVWTLLDHFRPTY